MRLLKNTLLLLLTISLFNCSDSNDLEVQNQQFDLENQLQVRSSTESVSPLFFQAGISKIEVSKIDNSIVFMPSNTTEQRHGLKNILLNGHSVLLSDYVVRLENGALYLNDQKDLQMTLKGDKPYLISDMYTGYLEDNNELLLDKNVSVLFTFLNELIISQDQKVLYSEAMSNIETMEANNKTACSFWDTYYSYGIGLNKAGAYANFEHNLLDDLTDGGMGANCTALGPPEHTSIGVAHYYTMAFCCP